MQLTGYTTFLRRLDDEDLKLIIVKDGRTVFLSNKDGMFPLLEAIEKVDPSRLAGSTIIDKMVGKAAALLICFLKAEKVYTKIMSLKAVKVMENHSIVYSAEKTIPEILNKFGTDICPFEKSVSDIDDPNEAYEKLRELARKMNPSC